MESNKSSVNTPAPGAESAEVGRAAAEMLTPEAVPVELGQTAAKTPATEALPAVVVQPEECPAFTLRADTRFGMLAMVRLTQMVREARHALTPNVPVVGMVAEVEAKMREFELFEERPRARG